MSKMLKLIVVAVLAALPACGGETYTLSDGKYVVSNLTASSDECELKADLAGLPLAVTVDSATDAIAIGFEGFDVTPPKGTIADNAFTATYEVAVNLGDCSGKGVKTFTGDLTANDQFEGTYEYKLQIVSGGAGCVVGDGCVSKFTFSANK